MAGSRPASRLPREISGLGDLARNLWWSWDPEATALWDEAEGRLGVPRGSSSPRNPVRLLRRAGERRLEVLASDRAFRARLGGVLARFRGATAPARPRIRGVSLPGPVAYFSMEFGLHESLPIYAGGLGILAGDHAKAASDLALPLVGVGLFYREGYFRQGLDPNGRQVVSYPRVEVEDLPLDVVPGRGGRPLRVRVELPGRAATLRVLRVNLGRVPIYLLDADIPENPEPIRALTRRLYIGDRATRIAQEVLCGIGGVRALRALDLHPSVYHQNEGHVAFLGLERMRELVMDGKLGFAAAVEAVAADSVFTTHTPVPEGNEVFALDLAHRYLAPHCKAAGFPVGDFLRLGLDRSPEGRQVLSMTVLALRLSRLRNGVSRLHGQVSRRMWRRLWPGFREERVPIGSVTNGIHTPTWVAAELCGLYRRRLGEDWTERLDDRVFWRRALRLRDEELWSIKRSLKEKLAGFVKERVGRTLDPDAFTIGFSRRFALYKRAGLLFRDAARARKLLGSPRRPVQVVYAGKPHPEDERGAELFEEIAALTRAREFRGRVVLIPDYDIEVARRIVQGSDLWLNTPRRPLEASGTSGQKAPINCCLNLSIRDGWWDEGWSVGAGWAFGKPIEYSDTRLQDGEDLEDLYRVLLGEVVQLYFERDRKGIPRRWLSKVKSAMALLVPRFSTARMVGEYARRLYLPAAAAGRRIRAGGARPARQVAEWRTKVERSWPLVHALRVARTGRRGEVDLFIAGLGPGDLAAEVEPPGTLPGGVSMRGLGEGTVRVSVRCPPHDGAARLHVWPRHPLHFYPAEMGASLEVEL